MIDLITKTDWNILNFIQNNIVNEHLNSVMIFLTDLGNYGILWILLSIAFLISKKHRKLGILLIIGLIAEVVTGNIILKNLIARPRPCWIDSSVPMLISIPKDYSFPSGHAFSSFIEATLIFKYNRKWGIYAYIAAALISFSRLYLFVHFPSDVLSGAVFGIILGILIYKAADRYVFQKRNLS